MNHRPLYLFSIILCIFNSAPSIVRGDGLTAINDSFHVASLYSMVKSDERHASVAEAHIDDPNTRKRLCTEIMGNDYFADQGLTPLDMDRPTARRDLQRRRNFLIFDQVYGGPSKQDDEPEYSNRYQLRSFKVDDGLMGTRGNRSCIIAKEWVFVCLVWRRPYISTVVSYYISREYDTGLDLSHSPRVVIAARFIFQDTQKIQRIVVAEEPAIGHASLDYDIEHHYIQLKEDHETANEPRDDPLCQLVPKKKQLNQNARLCASVLGSSYFKSIKHPHTQNNRKPCYRHHVSFQTENGKEMTRTMPAYHEWMILCKAEAINASRSGVTRYMNFGISRAYNSNELFVYRAHSINGQQRMYLENISTRIGIVDAMNVDDESGENYIF